MLTGARPRRYDYLDERGNEESFAAVQLKDAASMLTPVERSSLADEVAKKLRKEILTGSIKPGSRILEQEISSRMRTSRGPVRLALVQLEHEGLVQREPGRGATVVEMTIDDVDEVCSIRIALETLAFRYAIERADTADLAQLSEAVDRLRESLTQGYLLQDAVDLDLSFHEKFVKASRHNRIISMWQSIKPQIWFLIFSRKAYSVSGLILAFCMTYPLPWC